MKQTKMKLACLGFAALLVSCGDKQHDHDHDKPHTEHDAHADGEMGHDHGDEIALGTFKAGELEIVAAQSHGAVEAGKEGHLIIQLPYKDQGASIVRAWIGTDDRTMSSVGKGTYTASHGDYDIHAIAPTPLPENAQWWVEVEKPDGTKLLGSVTPKM